MRIEVRVLRDDGTVVHVALFNPQTYYGAIQLNEPILPEDGSYRLWGYTLRAKVTDRQEESARG